MSDTEREEEQAPYRVLTLDGGGMRGLYTATVLQTMMKRFVPTSDSPDLDIGGAFDLIVGTSTGGILACALAAGVPAESVIRLYREDGPRIFCDPMPSGGFGMANWARRNRRKPANGNGILKERLTQMFGDMTIKGLYSERGIGLCIPAVNMSTHRAWVFKTPHNPARHRDDEFKIVDVCLATSAAPMFLPLVDLPNPDVPGGTVVFADGGLWANNPVLIGLIEALGMAGVEQAIEVLSVGTCAPPSGKVITKDETEMGLLDWNLGAKALEVSLDAQASGYQFMADFVAKSLEEVSGRKCRIYRVPQRPPSPEHVEFLGLDKASDKALKVLTDLGYDDGNFAHSEALRDQNGQNNALISAFRAMKPAQPKAASPS